MKNRSYMITSCRDLACYVAVCLLLIQGCAKYKEFEAVFPPENNSLAKYQKIVIINKNRGEHLYDLMENALKSQLTSIHPGNVKPGKKDGEIGNEIKMFNYNPKIDAIPEQKIAYLSFDLKADEVINRQKKSNRVSLKSCDYLKKKDKCRTTGSASIASGLQTLKVILTGHIYLKNSSENAIIAATPIQRTLSDSGKVIKTPANLIFNGLNQVAYEYAKKIIPHKRRISSEILKGGDSISVKLIENGALNLAINRLDKITSKSDNPDYEDLYNLGLSYEALNEFQPALEHYHKANDLKPQNDAIKTALRRVQHIIQN